MYNSNHVYTYASQIDTSAIIQAINAVRLEQSDALYALAFLKRVIEEAEEAMLIEEAA